MVDIEFYRCEVCGNMAVKIKNGGGEMTCCGKLMTKLTANTTDASHEKHVPAITKENGVIKVAIGSVPHPMLPEHHIEWITLVTDSNLQVEFLKPGMEPKAQFHTHVSGTAYEYCNLHGLWKAEY